MLGCPINTFKLNECYLCNDIDNNMVMHTTSQEISFNCSTQLIILYKRVIDHLENTNFNLAIKDAENIL